MGLDECKICERNIQEYEYGRPISNQEAPYGLNICYHCLNKIYDELEEIRKQREAKESK